MEDLPYILHTKCYMKISELNDIMEEWRILYKKEATEH